MKILFCEKWKRKNKLIDRTIERMNEEDDQFNQNLYNLINNEFNSKG